MSIRARVKPSWPVLVAGEGGVTVSQSKGRAVIGFDYTSSGLGSELAQAVDSATTQAANAATSATAAAAAAVTAADSVATVSFASQAEAEAGTLTTKVMSPQRVVDAMATFTTLAYDTLAAVEAVTVPSQEDWIFVRGHTAAGDYGHGHYVRGLSSNQSVTDANSVSFGLFEPNPRIEQFGGFSSNGDASVTDAFNKAVAYGAGQVEFRSGHSYYFNSAPDVMTTTFRLHSSYSGPSGALYRNYNETTDTRGLFHWTAGTPVFHNIAVIANTGTSGGSLISLIATADTSPDWADFIGLDCTNAGTLKYTLYVDGSARTSPPGVRDGGFSHCHFFGADTAAVYLKSVTNWHGFLNIFSASGPGTVNGDLVITGTSSVHSTEINLQGCFVSNINLDYTTLAVLSFGAIDGDIINTSNVDKVTINGHFGGAGSVGELWTNSIAFINGILYLTGGIDVNALQVIGPRDTGWTAMTGTTDKASTYATSSVTLAQLAGRVMALQAALTTHGLLGS